MTLNIHVEAEPASLHQLADYLHEVFERARAASGDASSGRSSSQDSWRGDAGEGFRAMAFQLHTDGRALEDAAQSATHTVRAHADDIAAVQRRMDDARDVATKAGLAVTDREIHDPGPPPPQPEPTIIPSDAGAAGGVNTNHQREQIAASSDWADKAAAYAQCTAMVAEARTTENDGQTTALAVIEGITSHPIITGSNVLTGLASGYLSQQHTWRAAATSFNGIATDASQAAKNAAHGAPLQAKNSVLAMFAEARSNVLTDQANTKTIGRWLEHLPTSTQKMITAKLGNTFSGSSAYLSKAPAVFKKIPVVGSVFSAGSVVADAYEGKNVARSVASNASGLVTGTAAGGLTAGPPGALLGFVVGTGKSVATGELLEQTTGHEQVMAPGSGYTGRLQGPGDPGPM